jgi:predicted transcriptional regulator
MRSEENKRVFREKLDGLADKLSQEELGKLHEAIADYVEQELSDAIRDLHDRIKQRGIYSPDY